MLILDHIDSNDKPDRTRQDSGVEVLCNLIQIWGAEEEGVKKTSWMNSSFSLSCYITIITKKWVGIKYSKGAVGECQ